MTIRELLDIFDDDTIFMLNSSISNSYYEFTKKDISDKDETFNECLNLVPTSVKPDLEIDDTFTYTYAVIRLEVDFCNLDAHNYFLNNET